MWLRLVGQRKARDRGAQRRRRPLRALTDIGQLREPAPVPSDRHQLARRSVHRLEKRRGARGGDSAIESAKASSRSGRFSRVLPVLRLRGSSGEVAEDFQLLRGADGAMLAVVRRDRSAVPAHRTGSCAATASGRRPPRRQSSRGSGRKTRRFSSDVASPPRRSAEWKPSPPSSPASRRRRRSFSGARSLLGDLVARGLEQDQVARAAEAGRDLDVALALVGVRRRR